MLTALIESSGYGRVRVLRHIEFGVGDGEIVAVIGRNGAGKTTLIRTLSGTGVRARCEITLGGERIDGMRAPQRVARGVVQVPEGRKVFGEMTVLDNLLVGGYLHRADKRGTAARLDDVHALFPILDERRAQPAAALSGGEQQMLAIGRAMMARPRLLMVDEASLGLAPNLVSKVFRSLTTIRETGTAILLVEQNVRKSLEIADRAYLIERGSIAADGPAAEMLHDPYVAAAYLGHVPEPSRLRRAPAAPG